MEGLWPLLRCPACADSLVLERLGGGATTTREGLLRSGCGLWFPVIDDIPRIFVGEMRAVYDQDFGDFLSRHRLETEARARHRPTALKLSTRESFGFEWSHYHQMIPEWQEVARFYFEPLGGPEGVAGALALDAGCGMGRQAYHMLQQRVRLVAVDFSRAVEVARNNCAGLPGERLFVQADLSALPFAPATFDVVCSFGVLHHLPDPEGGFRGLVALLKPGGRILIYVYHALEGYPVKQAVLRCVTLARKLTTRLPHRVLLPLTTALGYGLYATVVLPYKLLSRISATREFAESLPLKFYGRYPVRVIVNDQFDRFSAPIENRYRRAEVEGWLERAGLVECALLGGAGWRALGRRPAGAPI